MDSTPKLVALIVAFLVVDIGVHSAERNCGTKYQKAIKTADHVASSTSEVNIKEVIVKFKVFFGTGR